jgi:hypothetical protein
MPKVFMAVSEDTPDVPGPCLGGGGKECPSPGFNVHSRFKQPTAARLARAGLGVRSPYNTVRIDTYVAQMHKHTR